MPWNIFWWHKDANNNNNNNNFLFKDSKKNSKENIDFLCFELWLSCDLISPCLEAWGIQNCWPMQEIYIMLTVTSIHANQIPPHI